MKLLHLERRSIDVENIFSQSVISALPSLCRSPSQLFVTIDLTLKPTAAYHKWAKSIQVMDTTDRVLESLNL
jgi:hypothetical protein